MSLIPGSSHRRATAVLVLLLCTACAGSAPASSAPGAPAPDASAPNHWTVFMDSYDAFTGPAVPFTSGTVSVMPVGRFQIVEAKDSISSQDIHGPFVWTKLYLMFSTSDRRAYVLLEDDGGGVSINVRAYNCLSSSRYYQYRDQEDESHLYRAMTNHLEVRLSTCPASVAGAEQYRREFQRAGADFPAAIREFKARVVAVFHGLEPRCRTQAAQVSPAASYERCQ